MVCSDASIALLGVPSLPSSPRRTCREAVAEARMGVALSLSPGQQALSSC